MRNKRKRPRVTDMEIAMQFKRGFGVYQMAFLYRMKSWKVEAAIRRVMKRLDKEHG